MCPRPHMDRIMDLQPTPYRVSTITCNATLSTQVSLPILFEHVRIQPTEIVWSEFNKLNKGTHVKKRSHANGEKKSFDNQVTVILYMGEKYYPNIKIFRNGSIQMTGIRTEADGLKAIRKVEQEIRRIAEEHDPNVVKDKANICGTNFTIRMINSDFAFPYKIRRKKLYNILISNKYNNSCSFQPLTYPGVKLQYFWNKNNKNTNGICECDTPCYGTGQNECKKVTVSVFDSGKTLITGANSFVQVNAAYDFICNVMKDNMHDLKKDDILDGL